MDKAAIAKLVASIIRAADDVVARIGAQLAVERRIASLGTVTEQTVIAVDVVGCIGAAIGELVADIIRAADPVLARIAAGLADAADEYLHAVAKEPVITGNVDDT